MKTLRLNEDIKALKVRLISENGEQLGIISTKEALEIAKKDDLTLVEIGPNSDPPVCKVMDYGKYKFEQRKKEKELKKKQTTVQVKELTMGPSIEQHDYEVKLKKAIEFLQEGSRIKITVRFKGRQIAHKDLGEAVLTKFQKDLEELGTPDKGVIFEGKKLTLTMYPKKK